jgi:hypothetical protein
VAARATEEIHTLCTKMVKIEKVGRVGGGDPKAGTGTADTERVEVMTVQFETAELEAIKARTVHCG